GTPVLGPSGFLRGEIGFGMLRRGAEGNPPKARESGETGRRAGLRIQWAQGPWGFNSPLSHQHKVTQFTYAHEGPGSPPGPCFVPLLSPSDSVTRSRCASPSLL